MSKAISRRKSSWMATGAVGAAGSAGRLRQQARCFFLHRFFRCSLGPRRFRRREPGSV